MADEIPINGVVVFEDLGIQIENLDYKIESVRSKNLWDSMDELWAAAVEYKKQAQRGLV